MATHATLTFLGAAGTVTGSKFLVEGSRGRILVDAGMFQGLRDLRRRNWEPLPFPPSELDAVVVTHAQLDHTGYLPALVRQGLQGDVLATAATIELAELMLRDSAKLQEEDAEYAATHGYSKHDRPRALYDTDDVEALLPLFRSVPLREPLQAADGIDVVLSPAGHILGSASVLVDADGSRAVFSGDLGRPHHPLLVAPDAPGAARTLVVESTYGDRTHDESGLDVLADVVTRTIARGGVVVMPAFAVDRTEVILMALRRLALEHRIPPVPVYVDSPMALGALRVYRRALERDDPDVRGDLGPDALVFDPGHLHEVRTAQESMALNASRTPCIIVSASGMATGGRVVHHLKHLLPGRDNAVVLVGYQAEGTRGRDLVEGATSVKFVYVVRGEPAASAALAERVRDELGLLAVVPSDGEKVTLRGEPKRRGS